jgi:hypothetical protein
MSKQKVISAKRNITYSGVWDVTLDCGHEQQDETERGLVIYPRVKLFCYTCWRKHNRDTGKIKD